jgi:hypothetical protein
MKKELKQQLKDKYKIFSDISEANISVGDGWYDAIDGGSQLIQEYLDKKPDMVVKVGQIKEKFGEMRFYVDGHVDEYINEIINTIEESANNTCERCGCYCDKKLNKAGWLKTMCDTCYDLNLAERAASFKDFANK